jgi:hypothetical protein
VNERVAAGASWQKLVVFETPSAYVVTSAVDPDDWIAKFEKVAGFPAREWAHRMAELYNAGGLDGQSLLVARRAISVPPPFTGYAPK